MAPRNLPAWRERASTALELSPRAAGRTVAPDTARRAPRAVRLALRGPVGRTTRARTHGAIFRLAGRPFRHRRWPGLLARGALGPDHTNPVARAEAAFRRRLRASNGSVDPS